MPTFAQVYSEPGVYVQPSYQIAPTAVAGTFTPALLGTGSIMKQVTYSIARGVSANTADNIVDSTGSIVAKDKIYGVLNVVDSQGRGYTVNQDYVLGYDATTGAGTIDWSPAGLEPQVSTLIPYVQNFYQVTVLVLKVAIDYVPQPVSDYTTFINLFGPVEHSTIGSLAITRGATAQGSDITTVSTSIYEALTIADTAKYYASGRDFNLYATTAVIASAKTAIAGGTTTKLVITTTDAPNVAVGQAVRFSTGTGSPTNDELLRFISVVSAVDTPTTGLRTLTLSVVLPTAVPDGNTYSIWSVSHVPTLGAPQLSSTLTPLLPEALTSNAYASCAAIAGVNTLIVDWAPASTGHQEPTVTSGIYTIHFESSAASADVSLNTLSIAYDILSQQGANAVVAAQFNPLDTTVAVTPNLRGPNGMFGATSGQFLLAMGAQLNTAPGNLYGRSDVQIIVPLLSAHKGNPAVGGAVPSTYHAVIDTVNQHCINASSVLEGRPRWAIMGAPAGTDALADVVQVFQNTAASTASNRLIYLAPSDNTVAYNFGTKTLDGSFLSAAVAGINGNSNYDAGEPMSGKTLVGFNSIDDIFTRYQKNQMAGSGVCYIENQGGTYRIRQFLTTNNSSVLMAEGKVTKITDIVRTSLQTGLKGLFINTRFIGQETLSQISSAINLILGGFVSRQTIISGTVISVVQDTIDPRQIDVSISIRPTYDVSFIFIDLQVSL